MRLVKRHSHLERFRPERAQVIMEGDYSPTRLFKIINKSKNTIVLRKLANEQVLAIDTYENLCVTFF